MDLLLKSGEVLFQFRVILLRVMEGIQRRTMFVSCRSLYELQTQLEISVNLKYMAKEKSKDIFTLINEIERMLNSMIRKLSGRQ